MRKPKVYSYLPGIVYRVQTAASCFLFCGTRRLVIPGFHSNSNHFITLLMKHHCCNGTIDSATHCHQHFSFLAHFTFLYHLLEGSLFLFLWLLFWFPFLVWFYL